MAAALRIETGFLRGFARFYGSEIGYPPGAERALLRRGVSLVAALHVLEKCRVVVSEKDDACGAFWVAEGPTCDDERLRLSLRVYCDQYRVCILDVVVLGSRR